MAALVTEAEVRAIYATDATSLTTFITTADLIVVENLTGKGLSSDRLKQIELYLSAHFAQLSDGGALTTQKLGDATDAFAVKTDMGFLSTQYGQTAVTLDSSGTLAEIATPKMKARFTIVGPSTSRRRADWPQT